MPEAVRLSKHDWYRNASGRPVVIDSDADNEIDDHFAVAWALAALPDLQALHAAPFHNGRSIDAGTGMAQSAEQLRALTEALDRPDIPVLDGSPGYLAEAPDPRPAAVDDLIERAAAGPVTVIAIGAITNLALALRAEPAIAANLQVVWLGGQPTWSYDPAEFNLSSDPEASRLVLESEVDLLLVPCRGVAELLVTTLPELESALPDSPIGRHLQKAYREQVAPTAGEGRAIWDMAAVACLLKPDAVQVADEQLPALDAEAHWTEGPRGRTVPVVQWIDRTKVYVDFFARLQTANSVTARL
ncbi:MAG TPA: nucleoside hydrolase [Mycobacteriales bacterium]|nr:nucleoside hydrolase [Mycobacteriales bacterium]